MSRIVVKNLPLKCTEELLKEIFCSHGELTDIKLVKTRGGTFRGFAYVGFRRSNQASEAIKHRDKTYVGSSKIEVEQALPIGDHSLARPWSKYSLGSSAHVQRERKEGEGNKEGKKEKGKSQEIVKKTKVIQLLEDYDNLEEDPSFQEFLDVHKHKEKVKTWSDNTSVPEEMAYGKGSSSNDIERACGIMEHCPAESGDKMEKIIGGKKFLE